MIIPQSTTIIQKDDARMSLKLRTLQIALKSSIVSNAITLKSYELRNKKLSEL